MFKHPVVKIILSAVAVAVFGYLLLNVTFLVDFLFQGSVIWIIKLFTSTYPPMDWNWFPPLMHGLFVVVIGLISWPIFRSKLAPIYKAIYLTVPTAVVLVTVGIFLYRWPVLSYSLGGLIGLGTLYFLYRTKQPWLYYYTVILVGLSLAIFSLLGGEI